MNLENPQYKRGVNPIVAISRSERKERKKDDRSDLPNGSALSSESELRTRFDFSKELLEVKLLGLEEAI